MWILDQAELRILDRCNVIELFKDRGIDRSVYIGSTATTDRLLFVDIESEPAVAALLHEIAGSKRLFMFEVVDLNVGIVQDDNGQCYRHEVMLSFLHRGAVQHERKVIPPNNQLKQRLPLFDRWLYLKVHCEPKRMNHVLTHLSASFNSADSEVWPYREWFFVRYKDQMDHLRIRIQISGRLDGFAAFQFAESTLSEAVACGLVTKLTIDTYEREIDRYGGASLSYCEVVMCKDSTLVLKLLSLKSIDFLEAGIGGVVMYLELFELEPIEKEYVLRDLASGYFEEHHGAQDLRIQFDVEYRKQSPMILKGAAKSVHHLKSNSNIVEEFNLLSIAIQELLPRLSVREERVEVLKSRIHMHSNRLFTSNFRLNELYLYCLLDKHDQQLSSQYQRAS